MSSLDLGAKLFGEGTEISDEDGHHLWDELNGLVPGGVNWASATADDWGSGLLRRRHRTRDRPTRGALVTVVVLIAAPEGPRGHLTRWMIEVATGVFVGNPSARVRDRVWAVLADRIHDG